jgi:hypothetical protein
MSTITNLTPKRIRARWFDPRNGGYHDIGHLSIKGGSGEFDPVR